MSYCIFFPAALRKIEGTSKMFSRSPLEKFRGKHSAESCREYRGILSTGQVPKVLAKGNIFSLRKIAFDKECRAVSGLEQSSKPLPGTLVRAGMYAGDKIDVFMSLELPRQHVFSILDKTHDPFILPYN